jgi:hypothetical protein
VIAASRTKFNENRMGGAWEDAFRDHLRLRVASGELVDDAVAVGPFWTAEIFPD